MCNFQFIVQQLVLVGIVGELWVGNSFVTDKINPKDIDVILSVDGSFFDNATAKQHQVMEWVGSNLENSLGCDSKILVNYHDGESEWDRTSYLVIFGFYHPQGPNVYERKGIASLTIPTCMP